MASAPFWIALVCQLIIVLGYFWFYRKEQLGEYQSASLIIISDMYLKSTAIMSLRVTILLKLLTLQTHSFMDYMVSYKTRSRVHELQ